jgi:hypothetical protein
MVLTPAQRALLGRLAQPLRYHDLAPPEREELAALLYDLERRALVRRQGRGVYTLAGDGRGQVPRPPSTRA